MMYILRFFLLVGQFFPLWSFLFVFQLLEAIKLCVKDEHTAYLIPALLAGTSLMFLVGGPLAALLLQ